MKNCRAGALSVSLLALCCGGTFALAQEPSTRPRQDIQGAAPGFEKEDTKWHAQLDLSASYRMRGDLSDTTGDVGILRTGMGLTMTGPVMTRNRLSVTLGSEQAWYDFSGSALLVNGDLQPWRHIQSYTIGANFATQWTETISTLAIGSINFAGENSAVFENGFTGGGGGAFIIKCSDTFDLTAGVFVRSKLGGGVYVFPFVGIDWRITAQWRLSSENTPGLYLSYAMNEQWRFILGGRYDYSEFRLDNSGVVPNGIGSDERVPVTFGVDWTPLPNLTVQGRIGAMVYEKLQERNSQRDVLGSSTVNPALYFSGGLVLKF